MKDLIVDLILEGGSQRVGYHIGFVNTLMKHNVRINNVYASSSGAWFGAYIVTNEVKRAKNVYFGTRTDSDLMTHWNMLSTLPFIGYTFLVIYLFIWNSAYKGLNESYIQALDKKLTKSQKDNFKKLHIVALSLNSNTNRWFNGYRSKTWHWTDAVVASMSLIGLVQSRVIGRERYVDALYNGMGLSTYDQLSPENALKGVHRVVLSFGTFDNEMKYRESIPNYLTSALYVTGKISTANDMEKFISTQRHHGVLISKFTMKRVLFNDQRIDMVYDKRVEAYNNGKHDAKRFIRLHGKCDHSCNT